MASPSVKGSREGWVIRDIAGFYWCQDGDNLWTDEIRHAHVYDEKPSLAQDHDIIRVRITVEEIPAMREEKKT